MEGRMVLGVAWLFGCPSGDSSVPHTSDTGTTETGTTGTTTPHTGDTGTGTDALAVVEGPTVGPTENQYLRLVQILTVATNEPTRASLVLDDGARRRRVTFPDLAARHELPLLALHQETHYDLEVTLTAEDGEVLTTSADFTTGAIPELLPKLELLANDPSAEPGYRVLPVGEQPAPFMVLVVDRDARPVWSLITSLNTKSVSYDPENAAFGWMVGGNVSKQTTTGEILGAWTFERNVRKGFVGVDAATMHHEVVFEPDGSFWFLSKESVKVPEFPVSELTPYQLEPATIRSDEVVHAAADGTVIGRWLLSDLFPTSRIGYDSVSTTEWAHANAVVPLSSEDAFVVSMRHQDAVAKIRQSTGEIVWILGNHDGWPAEYQDKLLTPVGPMLWNYHQHAPEMGPDGLITLFDNGNNKRTNPYADNPFPGRLFSRLVQFRIDEAAMTVDQVYAFAASGDPELYSEALGNADVLPVTGHLYGTFAFLYKEDLVRNIDLGIGRRTVRLIELDPATDAITWDLRVWAEETDVPDGYQVDRSIVIPSLYPADVQEEWLE